MNHRHTVPRMGATTGTAYVWGIRRDFSASAHGGMEEQELGGIDAPRFIASGATRKAKFGDLEFPCSDAEFREGEL